MKTLHSVYNDSMKTIFKTLVGSRLYGVDLPESDYDFKGVSLPSAEDLLGLKDTAREHWEVQNDPSTPGETVMHSVTKFLVLFMSGNPTVTELVFADEKYVSVHEPIWDVVKDFAKGHLMSRKIIGSYGGYINDQLKRVRDRKAQNNREVMIQKHGFDVKCASHVYRLAVQGVQLVSTGTCNPTLTGVDRDICISIKRGDKSYHDVVSLLEGKVVEYDMAAKSSVLKPLDKEAAEAKLDAFLVRLHGAVVREYLAKSA